ncbi:MAG: EFR1 family ferrodoxin [Candidatus Lokiarchaeota archaeon]
MKNILIIYFSPTGNTKRIATELEIKLLEYNNTFNITKKDITAKNARSFINLNMYDFIFLGSPIHAWNSPKVVRNWIKKLDGKGKKISMFFTYGGINPGVAHYYTMKLLEKQNFIVISSAEFVCSHSFNLVGWNLLIDRPNKKDLRLIEEFVRKTISKFTDKKSNPLILDDPKIPHYILSRIENNLRKMVESPSRVKIKCSLCYECEEGCPNRAFDAKKGKSDPKLCIRCFKCIQICQEEAIQIQDKSKFQEIILKMEKSNIDQIKNRESKIII